MMPSDMNLRISDLVAGYNNKILISRKEFGVGKNKLVNNKSNLIMVNKAPVVVVNKPAVVVVNKPTVSKPSTTVNKPMVNKPSSGSFTQEEEIAAVGVTLALIAGVWMIYK